MSDKFKLPENTTVRILDSDGYADLLSRPCMHQRNVDLFFGASIRHASALTEKIEFVKMRSSIEDAKDQNFALDLEISALRQSDPLCIIDSFTPSHKAEFVVMVNVLEKKAKQHKKRRNQSEAYHKRVQKKWDKKAQYDPEPKQLVAPARLTARLMEFAASYGQAKGRIFRTKTNKGG